MANLNYTFPAGFSIYTHNASASNAFTSVQNLNTGISRIWSVDPADSTGLAAYVPGNPFNPSWLTSFVPGSSYQVVSDGTASMQTSGSYPGITLRRFAGAAGTGYLGYAYLSMPVNSTSIDLASITVTKPDSTTVPFNSILTNIWTPDIAGAGAYQGWKLYTPGNPFNGFTTLLPGSSYYIDFGSTTGSYLLNIPRLNSYLITNNGNYITTNDARYITVSNNV